MSNVYVNASIEVTNKELYNVLQNVKELDSSKIELKIKDYGYEILYHDEHVYIYVYGNEMEKKEETVIFDCELKKEISFAHSFVNSIIEQLKKSNVVYYKFEYGESDSKGNEMGEQFEISS